MHAFQYFVHRTGGIIQNIASAPLNLPEGAFYSLTLAQKFAENLADGINFTVIYDAQGNLHTILRKEK